MAIETLGAPRSASNLEILASAAASRARPGVWANEDRGAASEKKRMRIWAGTKISLLRLGEIPACGGTKQCCAEPRSIDMLPHFLDGDGRQGGKGTFRVAELQRRFLPDAARYAVRSQASKRFSL